MAAAAVQFNSHGVKGATLAGIASSVGLVTNSVTYYYRKKEDLACACFLRATESFDAIARRATADHERIEDRLRSFYHQLATLMQQIEEGRHPPLVTFNDLRALPPPQFELVTLAYNGLFRHLRALMRGPETRNLTRAELNARTYAVLSMAHAMRLWLPRYEPSSYCQMADRLVDILLHGSAAPGSQWLDATEVERGWRFRQDVDPTLEAFLRAASQMVNTHGYQGASVDKISAQLNVTKGSFYHHNDNKEDLVWACFERSFEIIRSAMEASNQSFGTGWERACAATRALARFQLSQEGPLLRLGATSALNAPERRREVARSINRMTLRMCHTVVDGMIDGSMRPLDPNVAGQIGGTLISGVAGLRLWVRELNEDNVADLYLRPVFTGLLN